MDPYIYQYAIGGIVFLIGLVYAARQGYIGFSGTGLRNLLISVGGLAFFMLAQGYMQYGTMQTAPPVAFRGGKAPVLGNWVTYSVIVGYFALILFIGTFFGRNQKNTKDFFFGGQRFSWWLIAFSLIATTIGSYSFVKYSKIAFKYGLASSQTYLNDWFWLPLLIFGWLPILYFSRITSIPEYFERRFHPAARKVVTWLLLLYLVGYVGVNLFTMGKALNILLGWPVPMAALLVASISAVYVTMGGQTSVIMTDLFQGVMLLACGLLIVYLGAEQLGGLSALWDNMPRSHRTAFVSFNKSASYSSVGIFWQDAMANSAMLYFLNQGILMRFMAARSIKASRRAVITVLLILMPIAAIVVASGGWVGKALVHAGYLPANLEPAKAFFVASRFLSSPFVFGIIMAALTAALMSTVDTLITAIAAIIVNDVYKPKHPKASEAQLLRVARISSISITMVGVALVPLFMTFDSIYSAHGAFTAAITPPLVVALLLGVFWRRYTPTAAIWTMLGGMLAVVLSIFFPVIITPFAHGVPMLELKSEGLFAGIKQYKFMRAFFGLGVSLLIGIVVTYLSQPRPLDEIRGLVWGTVTDAIRNYKGSTGKEVESEWVYAHPQLLEQDEDPEAYFDAAVLSKDLAIELRAQPGDLLFVSDTRWWLGGLRAKHAMVQSINEQVEGHSIHLTRSTHEAVVAPKRGSETLRIKKLYDT